MPLIRGLEDDEKKRALLGRAPMQSGGAAPTAAPQTQATSPAQSSVPGGKFTNLQDYLKANQGQGKAMVNRIATPLDNTAKMVGGVGPITPGKLEPVGGNPNLPSALGPRQTRLGAAPSPQPGTPQNIALTPEQEEYNAQEVTRAAGLAQTAGGQKQLLDIEYGKGRSAGESDFDNALMGGEAGSRLAELSKKYSGLHDMVKGRNAYNLAQQQEQARQSMARAEDERRIREAQDKAAAEAAAASQKTLQNAMKRGGQDSSYDADGTMKAEAWAKLPESERQKYIETLPFYQQQKYYNYMDPKAGAVGEGAANLMTTLALL